MDVDVFLEWFGRWKDVITTIVAIMAIVVVVVQIRQVARNERKKLVREQNAARAVLPLTLAALDDYGRAMLTALAPLEEWTATRAAAPAPFFVAPILPIEAIGAVQEVISAYPGQHVSRALAAVIGEVQVLQSRSASFVTDHEIRSWRTSMPGNLVLAASIVARCQNLYSFARAGTDFAQPSSEELRRVLSLARLPEQRYSRVWESAKQVGDGGVGNQGVLAMLKRFADRWRTSPPGGTAGS